MITGVMPGYAFYAHEAFLLDDLPGTARLVFVHK